jgi:hypothetical protein
MCGVLGRRDADNGCRGTVDAGFTRARQSASALDRVTRAATVARPRDAPS